MLFLKTNSMKTNYIISFFFAFFSVFCFSQNFTDSNLPIIILNTSGLPIDSAYTPTFIIGMKVIDNGANRNHISDPSTYTCQVKIKVHGNSTQWFPKKAWNITTINTLHANQDTSLLGLPREHDWIFKALYEDKTLLRDDISFKIFREMGHYGSRSRFFELVVDGNYRGVYQLEEKIKHGKNRVNIAKLKASDIAGDLLSGGYIVHIDRLKVGDKGWTSKYPSNAGNDSANTYVYEYPKPDSMSEVQKDYIHNLFDQFEGVVHRPNWNNPDSGYSKYVNVASLVDKFLIEEISRNTDAYRLKDFFYKERNSKGDGKIHAGPIWDYAIGWGNCSFSGGDNPYWWQYSQPYYTDFIPFWWRKILTDPAFQNAIKCRYKQLRATTLNKNYVNAHIDSMVIYLSEGRQRNFQRWQILGHNTWPEPQPVPADYNGEIARLKWWIDQRLTWLDTNIPGICNNLTGINEIADSTIINLFPNPFNNSFRLDYSIKSIGTSAEKKQVIIELFDVLGKRVFLSFADKTFGLHSDEITTSQLSSGIYNVKVSIDDKTYSRKLVKE